MYCTWRTSAPVLAEYTRKGAPRNPVPRDKRIANVKAWS